MDVKLVLSEVNAKLPSMMGQHQHIQVVTDDDEHVMDVYSSDDIESVFETLNIITDPETMRNIEIALRELEEGDMVVVYPNEVPDNIPPEYAKCRLLTRADV